MVKPLRNVVPSTRAPVQGELMGFGQLFLGLLVHLLQKNRMVGFSGVYEWLYILEKTNTLWLFNIAMENGPFIDGLPGFTY
jgi:hypothetical protein